MYSLSLFAITLAVLNLPLNAVARPGYQIFKRGDNCNADNCMRALKGRATMAATDCSAFFQATVIACDSTSTVTSTLTVAPTVPTSSSSESSTSYGPETTGVFDRVKGALRKNPPALNAARPVVVPTASGMDCSPATIAPYETPSYASACSGVVRYSSACSCMDVAPTTTTYHGVAITTAYVTVTTPAP